MGEGETDSFLRVYVAAGKLTMLQGKATYPGVFGWWNFVLRVKNIDTKLDGKENKVDFRRVGTRKANMIKTCCMSCNTHKELIEI